MSQEQQGRELLRSSHWLAQMAAHEDGAFVFPGHVVLTPVREVNSLAGLTTDELKDMATQLILLSKAMERLGIGAAQTHALSIPGQPFCWRIVPYCPKPQEEERTWGLYAGKELVWPEDGKGVDLETVHAKARELFPVHGLLSICPLSGPPLRHRRHLASWMEMCPPGTELLLPSSTSVERMNEFMEQLRQALQSLVSLPLFSSPHLSVRTRLPDW